MNSIEIFRDRVRSQFPSAELSIDAPLNPNGVWHLDIKLGEKDTVVEWKPSRGFGLCTCKNLGDHGFGEGPDVVHEDIDSAFEALVEILSS
jgi:hypothetical protein